MNIVEATLTGSGEGMFVEFGGNRLAVPDEVVAERPGLAAFRGRTVIVGIRPEAMEDAALVPSPHADSRLPIVVELQESMGSDVYLHFKVDAPPVYTEDTKELAADVDEKVLEELKEQAKENRTTFIARTSPETRARVGQSLELSVDTRKLYFFDPVTGESIYEREPASSDTAASVTA